MTATAGSVVGWMIGNKTAVQEVDPIKERAIKCLEELESVMSEAVRAGRYDVVHKTIRAFAWLAERNIVDAVGKYEAEHPGEETE